MLNQLLRFDSDVQFGTPFCGPRRCGNLGETFGRIRERSTSYCSVESERSWCHISFENIFCTSQCENTVVARHC